MGFIIFIFWFVFKFVYLFKYFFDNVEVWNFVFIGFILNVDIVYNIMVNNFNCKIGIKYDIINFDILYFG